MHGLSFLTAALAVGASASPFSTLFKRHHGGGYGECLDESTATTVANNFRATIAEPFDVSFVKATFTRDFTDYSDSVNELINSGCPNGPATLGSATFPSRAAFIAGQSQQAPITFNILNQWYTCDTVIIRWQTPNPGFVDPEQPVTGIIVIETKPNQRPDGSASSQPFLIETVYSEFNSGAWLYDIGNFTPTCTAARKRVAQLGAFM